MKILTRIWKAKYHHYNISHNSEFDFWNKHSPNLALRYITEKIRKNLDNMLYVCGVNTDLEKAQWIARSYSTHLAAME